MTTLLGLSPAQKKSLVLEQLKQSPTKTLKNGITIPNTYNSLMVDLELAIIKEKYGN